MTATRIEKLTNDARVGRGKRDDSPSVLESKRRRDARDASSQGRSSRFRVSRAAPSILGRENFRVGARWMLGQRRDLPAEVVEHGDRPRLRSRDRVVEDLAPSRRVARTAGLGPGGDRSKARLAVSSLLASENFSAHVIASWPKRPNTMNAIRQAADQQFLPDRKRRRRRRHGPCANRAAARAGRSPTEEGNTRQDAEKDSRHETERSRASRPRERALPLGIRRPNRAERRRTPLSGHARPTAALRGYARRRSRSSVSCMTARDASSARRWTQYAGRKTTGSSARAGSCENRNDRR